MKASAIIRLCIWSVIAILLCAILALGMIHDSLDFGDGFLKNGNYRYPEVSTYSIGNTELASNELHSIEVDWVAGGIQIVPYDGDTVKIIETDTSNRNHAMRWRIRNGVLQIRYSKPYNMFGFGIGPIKSKELTVYLPVSAETGKAYLQQLTVHNVSSGIHINELQVDEVDIESVSAKIFLQNMEVDELELENVSGRVDIDDCVIDILDVRTVSGNVLVEGTVGEVDMQTVSAWLDITSMRCPSYVAMESVSGYISLAIPADTAGFRLELDTLSGSFGAPDFHMQSLGSGSYVYGDGSARFHIEGVSGRVDIQKISTEE